MWLTEYITFDLLFYYFGEVCNAKSTSQMLCVLAETSLLKLNAQLFTEMLSSNS